MIHENDVEIDNEDCYFFKKLYYYDFEFDESIDFKNTMLINNAISFAIQCRRCHQVFSFNNEFYKHFRISCQKKERKIFLSILL